VNRSFEEKLRDFETDPDSWELISAHSEFASRKGSRRLGVSMQAIYRHRRTGETMTRHTVTDDRGRIVDDHFRPDYKPRKGELREQE